MADIVVTVAVVVCRIPSGTPGSRYQSLRKKCNRIVRSSGSKSMSSSKSLLIGDHFGLGMMIGMIGFDKCMPCSNIHIIHTHAHTHTHGKWFTAGCSDFEGRVFVSVCVRFLFFIIRAEPGTRQNSVFTTMIREWKWLDTICCIIFLRFVCSFCLMLGRNTARKKIIINNLIIN